MNPAAQSASAAGVLAIFLEIGGNKRRTDMTNIKDVVVMASRGRAIDVPAFLWGMLAATLLMSSDLGRTADAMKRFL